MKKSINRYWVRFQVDILTEYNDNGSSMLLTVVSLILMYENIYVYVKIFKFQAIHAWNYMNLVFIIL